MDRDSKIKLDQIRPVSEELIIHKFKDTADRDILTAIGNYFIEEAREIYRIDLAA